MRAISVAAERKEMAMGQLLEMFGGCCRVSEPGRMFRLLRRRGSGLGMCGRAR